MADPRQTPAQRELLEHVRFRMEAEGLSLRDVAEKVGCSPSTLSRAFNGKIGLTAAREARLVASFPVDHADVESAVAMIRGLSSDELTTVLQILQIVQRLRGGRSTG